MVIFMTHYTTYSNMLQSTGMHVHKRQKPTKRDPHKTQGPFRPSYCTSYSLHSLSAASADCHMLNAPLQLLFRYCIFKGLPSRWSDGIEQQMHISLNDSYTFLLASAASGFSFILTKDKWFLPAARNTTLRKCNTTERAKYAPHCSASITFGFKMLFFCSLNWFQLEVSSLKSKTTTNQEEDAQQSVRGGCERNMVFPGDSILL